MAEKVTSSESTGQAEGQASDEEHSDASDEEHSDDGGGDASSTRDESIKTTDKPSRELVGQMIKAAEEGDVNALKDIVEANPDCISARFDYEFKLHGQTYESLNATLLHVGALNGHINTLDYLLSLQGDIDVADEYETTPLHLAALGRQVEAVKFLMEHGADIHKTDKFGSTILHAGAGIGKVEVMKYLVEKGLDVNQADNDGYTPLHVTAEEGEVKAIKFLTEHGADIYKTNQKGDTPLLGAVRFNKGNVVRYLILQFKIDITQLDQEEQSKIKRMLEEESESEAESDGDDEPTSHAENGADDNEEDMQRAYSMALRDGEAQSSSVSIYILGQQSAGKTCLVASLLGDKFEENAATQGADIEVCTIFASQWSRVEKKKVPKQLQKRYLGKLKVTAEIKITAERQKSVSKAQNKQQLLESLPQLPQAVKEDLEQAKTAVLIDEDGINVIIWDFAGQSVYYGLHSMFLKEDNVAMIVFDASQGLQDAAKGRSTLKDPYTQQSINPITTGYESVCYWLKSIHSICRKDGIALGAKSKFVPTVFLVATHIDLIGDKEAVAKRRQEIIDQLFLALRNKPFAQHLAGIENGLREALEKNCFFISNKLRDQEELNRLRAFLAKASHYITSKQHPVVYVNIERHLLSLTKLVISIGEFHKIAIESGFFAELLSPEFKGALAHFHSKGTILHFPQAESLKDIVVLSPDWLTKLFAYIIVGHPYKLGLDRDLQFERLKNRGILEEDFVAYMVEKFNKEQEKYGLPLTTKQAIEFAQLFGFITEVNSSTYFLEEVDQPPASDGKVFIVPAMLPLKLPDYVQLPKDSDPQARVVYFRFLDGFIPLMVYYLMLGACINRNIKQGEDLFWMRRHIIKLVLGTDQLYYVSLCEEYNSIRIAITPDEEGKVTSKGLQERWKLIEYFNTKLREIVKTFMPASDLPQCYIPCIRCPNLHLKLDSIREISKPLNCVRGKIPKDYYSDLRQCQDVDEATDMDIDAVIDTGKLKVIFKKVPTIRKLVSYLKELTNWKSFGYFLLPEEHEHLVKEIQMDNEGKGIKSCKMALYETFSQCGVRTWETVVNALEKSDNDDLAKQVKMHLIKDYPS